MCKGIPYSFGSLLSSHDFEIGTDVNVFPMSDDILKLESPSVSKH